MIASFEGHIDVVRVLIEAGANIHSVKQVDTLARCFTCPCTLVYQFLDHMYRMQYVAGSHPT